MRFCNITCIQVLCGRSDQQDNKKSQKPVHDQMPDRFLPAEQQGAGSHEKQRNGNFDENGMKKIKHKEGRLLPDRKKHKASCSCMVEHNHQNGTDLNEVNVYFFSVFRSDLNFHCGCFLPKHSDKHISETIMNVQKVICQYRYRSFRSEPVF